MNINNEVMVILENKASLQYAPAISFKRAIYHPRVRTHHR